jgi:K+-sensing histidine kinase KdpD
MENDIDEGQRGNLLSRVWSTTTSMDLLVKNVLDLYLLDEQRLRPNPRMIDINAVVAETAEQIGIEATLKGLKLLVELGRLPKIKLDPLHLERITSNLLASAITRTSAGTITVRTLERDEAIVIEIRDTGPEVRDTESADIFARPKLTSGAKSAALSRYIASALVAVNGGTIEASIGDGGGLTLSVLLPCEASPVPGVHPMLLPQAVPSGR